MSQKLTKDGRIIRPPNKGMGEAVFARVIQRTHNGVKETWEDVAKRVALGNSMLHPSGEKDREFLESAIAGAACLMSGRHLQHGDETQVNRSLHVFSNCATAAFSHIEFLLLLSGSGVGRSYDDKLMLVNWAMLPHLKIMLSEEHADYQKAAAETGLLASYSPAGAFRVADSREGWAKVVEMLEMSAFRATTTGERESLVLDFTDVRPEGSPIAGMQNRPASGPVPLMVAIQKLARVAKQARDEGWMPWKTAMFVDHYLAECVVVGGARRSARIALKHWKDPGIFEFIELKHKNKLWSANNSVAVDEEFWADVKKKKGPAYIIFLAVTSAQFDHMTGEPGFINVHKVSSNKLGLQRLTADNLIDRSCYDFDDLTKTLYAAMIEAVKLLSYNMIVNPCGEIALFILGGLCIIADSVPYFAKSLEDWHEILRHIVRALIRANLMPSIYSFEVARTNRIGVGITGLHEFAWKFFQVDFKTMLDPHSYKGLTFWDALAIASRVVVEEADRYSDELGVARPHTCLTFKPAGTNSKLKEISEGPHRPARRRYKRNVQFLATDPLVAKYEAAGFPVVPLKDYAGNVIVGFPAEPEICRIMPDELIVTATEVTLKEDFEYLQLLEDNWLEGCGAHPERANQISYTMKFNADQISPKEYRERIAEFMPTVKACSMLPYTKESLSSYEYLPEEEVTPEEYNLLKMLVDPAVDKFVSMEYLQCETGACPL